jgi:hypothetical protein
MNLYFCLPLITYMKPSSDHLELNFFPNFFLARRQLLEGRFVRHRGQVHRRERSPDPRDVQLRARPSALHHLHGRDRCHRRQKVIQC